jgi:hypothetical protein
MKRNRESENSVQTIGRVLGTGCVNGLVLLFLLSLCFFGSMVALVIRD